MKFINIHGHKVASLKNEVAINNIIPGEYYNIQTGQCYSVGLHPWYIEEGTIIESIDQIKLEAKKKEVIAIGETGLDKIIETPYELQVEVFEKHIQISELVQKPLIIHCVKSFNELILLKKKYKPRLPWIVHGYNSKVEVAAMLLKQNIFLSFGKGIMYPLSNAAQVLSQIPYSSFFLETDDSEYTIKEIYNAAAQIKKIETDKLKSIVLQNFNNCFGI